MGTEKAIAVLDRKSFDEMRREGGVGYWFAKESNVLDCEYVVATVNKRLWKDAPWEHGTAYFIGRISGIRRRDTRLLILVSEYLPLEVPEAWQHSGVQGSNAIRYLTLQELGIKPKDLARQWRPWPSESAKPLSIAEAKVALAATLGVSPDKIEITIKA